MKVWKKWVLTERQKCAAALFVAKRRNYFILGVDFMEKQSYNAYLYEKL